MYSTTAIAKNSRLTGRLVGTHQQLDRAARKCLARRLHRGWYFPVTQEILHFEGIRGPDGLKSKSPDDDDPSHMFGDGDGAELISQVVAHYHNLVQALKDRNQVRAAFEAAWLAHKTTDALTPAHHVALAEAKEELMSNKEMFEFFGTPIKGMMHGRNLAETARNNWLFWGAGGTMLRHIAYEYGVALIAATMPKQAFVPKFQLNDFVPGLTPEQIIAEGLAVIQPREVYQTFRKEGWVTDLAMETKNVLLPEVTRAITRMWYIAAAEAYQEPKNARKK